MDYHFDLVKTNYPIKEGKEVIMSLISDKINFLERTIFGLEERLGADTSHLAKRVAELKSERENLEAFLGNLNNDNMMLSINCPVTIECKEINSNELSQMNSSEEA